MSCFAKKVGTYKRSRIKGIFIQVTMTNNFILQRVALRRLVNTDPAC